VIRTTPSKVFGNFRMSLISLNISRQKSTEYFCFILTEYHAKRLDVYSVKFWWWSNRPLTCKSFRSIRIGLITIIIIIITMIKIEVLTLYRGVRIKNYIYMYCLWHIVAWRSQSYPHHPLPSRLHTHNMCIIVYGGGTGVGTLKIQSTRLYFSQLAFKLGAQK